MRRAVITLSRLTQEVSAGLLEHVGGAVAVVPHGLADCGRGRALREVDGGGDGRIVFGTAAALRRVFAAASEETPAAAPECPGATARLSIGGPATFVLAQPRRTWRRARPDGGGDRGAKSMVLGCHRAAVGVIGGGAGESVEAPALELQRSARPVNVLFRGLDARWEVGRRSRRGRRRGWRLRRRCRRWRNDVGDAKARPKGGAVAGFEVAARLRRRRRGRLGLTGGSVWVDDDVGIGRGNGELRRTRSRYAADSELGVATGGAPLVVATPGVTVLEV